MKTGCIRYGYDAALMILSHLTINSMKQFVLFVTTKQSTFNFFRPPSRGRKIFFFARFAREHQPPISIFVILTLHTRCVGCVRWGYQAEREFNDIFSLLDTIFERDVRTDRRRDIGRQLSCLSIASRGNFPIVLCISFSLSLSLLVSHSGCIY